MGTGVTVLYRPARVQHKAASPPEPIIHVLYVTDAIREPLTGVGRMALVLLRQLVQRGVSVQAVDWRRNDAVAGLGIDQITLPIGAPMRTGRWHLSLLRRLRQSPADATEVLFDPTGYPNALGSHPRQVLLIHDLSMLRPATYRAGKRLWFRLFMRRSLAKARFLACVSEYTRRQLVQQPGVDPRRCRVVPNCLDPELRRPSMPPAPRTQAPFFLSVGTWERRKNLVRLLDAFAMQRSAMREVRLCLAGRPGHGHAEIRRRAEQPDLAGAIDFVLAPDDAELAALYHHALALLFPSLEEGFGLPILEAMDAGIPVLTSNNSATAEVAGDAGLLIDPTDTHALAQGIGRLATDDGLRQQLIAKGRARLELFSADRSGQALLEVLQQAAAGSLG